MIKKYSKLLIIVLLLILIFIGFRLRFRSYQFYPPIASTFDEQVVVWAGSSLINTGIPTSWSFIDDYLTDNRGHFVGINNWSIYYDNQNPNLSNFKTFPKPLSHRIEFELDQGYKSQFVVVQPQIEQPPLGPLLSAFLSGSYKLKTFSDIRLEQIRIPVIYLSVISILLVFVITKLAYDTKSAIISATLFTFVPTLVISQRLAVSENYLTFFILIGILFNLLWIKTNQTKFLILNSLLIIICYLIKPFGISLAIVLGLSIFVYQKPLKFLIYPLISTFISILIFYFYGSFYSLELFTKVVSYQQNRFNAPLQGIFKLLIPRITNLFLDGWIIFGYLSVFYLTLRNRFKEDFWVVAPILSSLFFFFIYGGEDYGWYRLILYPFLMIGMGKVISDAFDNVNPFLNVSFLILVLPTNLWWGFYGTNWYPLANIFRIVMVILLGIFTLGFLKQPIFKKLNQLTLLLLILFSLWLSVKTINNTQSFYPNLSDQTSIIPFRR